MRDKDLYKKFFAGLFVIAGVILVFWVILTIGIEKGVTQPKFQVTLLFHEVGGLAVGAPVALLGVNVGTVADIGFLDHEIEMRGVKVITNIFTKYRPQIEKAYRFAIKTNSILGEKYIEISKREDVPLLDLSRPIIGEDPLDVQDLAVTFGKAAVAMLETSKAVDSILKEMKWLSNSSKRLLNRIEQRLLEGNLFKVF